MSARDVLRFGVPLLLAAWMLTLTASASAAGERRLRASAKVVTSSMGLKARPSAPVRGLFGIADQAFYSRAGDLTVPKRTAELGAEIARIDMPWSFAQPEADRWDWNLFDRLHAAYNAEGVKLVAIVQGIPEWAAPKGADNPCRVLEERRWCRRPPPPDRLDEWQEFVRRLAQRYPDLAAIEVWNEPNLGKYNWRPQADPEYYVQVLRAARAGARAADADVPVLSGGLSIIGEPETGLDMDVFLERMYRAGAKGLMDGISFHPYPGGISHEDPRSYYFRAMAGARRVRAAFDDTSTPFWLTELGYSSYDGTLGVSAEAQGRMLGDVVRASFLDRDVAATIVYNLVDGPDRSSIHDNYGLLDTALAPKPAYGWLFATLRPIGGWRVSLPSSMRTSTSSSRTRRLRLSSRR